MKTLITNLKHLLFIILSPVWATLVCLAIIEFIIRCLLDLCGFEIDEDNNFFGDLSNYMTNLSNFK